MDSVQNFEPLAVALVGCGRLAEYHLKFLTASNRCKVVAVADVNIVRARQIAEKFSIPHAYSSLEELLAAHSVDAVHIVTPPATHYSNALTAINHGAHVLIEKPLTFRTSELRELYDRAREKGVSICPDFTQLFHPIMLKAQALIESGALGRVVRCHSSLVVEVAMPHLREAPGLHWAFNLPLGLMHDYMSHALYLVLAWVGVPKRVEVIPHSFGALPQGLTDHLEIIVDGESVSGHASVALVTAPRPGAYYVQIVCEKGMVVVDFDSLSLRVERSGKLPRAIQRATWGFRVASEAARGGVKNIVDVLRGKLVPYHGLGTLIDLWYLSMQQGTAPPISRELALAVTQTEEATLTLAGRLHLDLQSRKSRQSGVSKSARVVVTGAAGYLGTEIVRSFVDRGYWVRAMVRPLSPVDELERLGVEIVFGDIRDPEQTANTLRGMDLVVHAAAGLRGNREFIVDTCVNGTRNLAEAAAANGVDHVIYVSSTSVYQLRRGKDVLTENSPLDPAPELRGAGTFAKHAAEEVALSYVAKDGPHWTILRPSLIFGNGRDLPSQLGIKIGRTLVSFGGPGKALRLVHVRDVAEAIVGIAEAPEARGKVFNVSHPMPITMGEYAKTRKDLRFVYLPYPAGRALALVAKVARALLKRGPNLGRSQLASLYSGAVVSADSIHRTTGWGPSAALPAQLAPGYEATLQRPQEAAYVEAYR